MFEKIEAVIVEMFGEDVLKRYPIQPVKNNPMRTDWVVRNARNLKRNPIELAETITDKIPGSFFIEPGYIEVP